MPQVNTKRPYQERFLDNFDRAQLRREVQAVPPRRFRKLRKKYATWALGASLAIGGIGAPLKMMHDSEAGTAKGTDIAGSSLSLDRQLANDLRAAESIATQGAGGVAGGGQAAAQAPLSGLA